MRLNTIFENIVASARTASVVSSVGRGQFRREISLSPRRLAALLVERNLEVTLERTLIALKADELGVKWFNQLNVAAGVGRGNRFNRAAVDLARIDCSHGRLRLQELKGWSANDAPRAAAEELFRYAAWLSVLRAKGFPPYVSAFWTEIAIVELQLIAPADYFNRHGGVETARSILERAEAELEELRNKHAELARVSFITVPVALPAYITIPKFVHFFDSRAIALRIAQRSAAPSALDVLRPEMIEESRQWFADALAASLN